jgi:hypothetical protein
MLGETIENAVVISPAWLTSRRQPAPKKIFLGESPAKVCDVREKRVISVTTSPL